MMTVSLPFYLILLANAALIVAAVFAILELRRRLGDSTDFWHSPTGAALQADGSATTAEQSRLIAARMAALERAVAELGRRSQTTIEERVVDPAMAHAVRMAKRGADIDDLTQSCGLNIGEAKLLHRLHGKRPNAEQDSRPLARSA